MTVARQGHRHDGTRASSKNKIKEGRKREKKKRMIECEKNMKQNKTARKKIISSCTNLVGDHGAHRRDERQSYGQKQEKKEEKKRERCRRRRKEGEEERERE